MSFAMSEILEDFAETSSLPQHRRRVHRDDDLFDDSRSLYSEERWRREALKIKLLFSFSSPPPSLTRTTCDRCGGVLERREGVRHPVHVELRSHPRSRHCAYTRGT